VRRALSLIALSAVRRGDK